MYEQTIDYIDSNGGTIYIFFEEFEIGIGLFYLFDEGEQPTAEEVFKRGLDHLEKKNVPYQTFAGYDNITYEISL